MSKDPIGFNGGQANLYVYVGNDSVNDVDLSGKSDSSECEDLASYINAWTKACYASCLVAALECGGNAPIGLACLATCYQAQKALRKHYKEIGC